MAEVCEIITINQGGAPAALGYIEENVANALVVDGWLAFTVGDPAVIVAAKTKTPYDPATGELEVCYDDGDLPAGVTALAGNSECPRNGAEPEKFAMIVNDSPDPGIDTITDHAGNSTEVKDCQVLATEETDATNIATPPMPTLPALACNHAAKKLAAWDPVAQAWAWKPGFTWSNETAVSIDITNGADETETICKCPLPSVADTASTSPTDAVAGFGVAPYGTLGVWTDPASGSIYTYVSTPDGAGGVIYELINCAPGAPISIPAGTITDPEDDALSQAEVSAFIAANFPHACDGQRFETADGNTYFWGSGAATTDLTIVGIATDYSCDRTGVNSIAPADNSAPATPPTVTADNPHVHTEDWANCVRQYRWDMSAWSLCFEAGKKVEHASITTAGLTAAQIKVEALAAATSGKTTHIADENGNLIGLVTPAGAWVPIKECCDNSATGAPIANEAALDTDAASNDALILAQTGKAAKDGDTICYPSSVDAACEWVLHRVKGKWVVFSAPPEQCVNRKFTFVKASQGLGFGDLHEIDATATPVFSAVEGPVASYTITNPDKAREMEMHIGAWISMEASGANSDPIHENLVGFSNFYYSVDGAPRIPLGVNIESSVNPSLVPLSNANDVNMDNSLFVNFAPSQTRTVDISALLLYWITAGQPTGGIIGVSANYGLEYATGRSKSQY